MKILKTFNPGQEKEAIELFSALRTFFPETYKVELLTTNTSSTKRGRKYYFEIYIDIVVCDLAKAFIMGFYYKENFENYRDRGIGFVSRSYLEEVKVKECYVNMDERRGN